MNRAYVILAVLLVAIVGVGAASRILGQGDDKAMIKETLRLSLQASREGKPGNVMEALSKSLTVNDQEASGNMGMVANYIKNQKPDLEVTNPTPIVTGDEARILSPVKIKTSLPFVGEKTITVKDVTMVFHRETAREYLVIPVKKWRLVQVLAPPVALDTLGIE